MMKKLLTAVVFLLFILSCGHKYYTATTFEQQSSMHKLVAILPAEMIYTGKQPETMTPDEIQRIEESESRSFQRSLYNNILRYANSRKYYTTVNFQDVIMTQKLLDENKIGIRDAWRKDDKELVQLLKVDAIVRMRIQKQRYMSDLASYGISVGRQIINSTGLGSRLPLPYVQNKTSDIFASCDLVSNNQTLWNDNYREASDWSRPSDVIIEGITDNFGRHFPYKRKK
jgi:hypothetical protein